MNILQVFSTNIPPCEGIASHVLDLSKRLSKRGHKVNLLTRSANHRKFDEEHEGFSVIKVPFYPIYPLHVYFQRYFVRNAISSLCSQPDIIHLHTPLVPSIGKMRPIVTTFHTPMLVDTSKIESVNFKAFLIKIMGKTTSYWIEAKLLNISDAVIAVSKGVADDLRRFYGYKKYIFTIPNVVDTDFFKPSIFNQKDQKILYVGRLSYRKGLLEIVKSAKHVINKKPDIQYVIIGSGPLEKYIRDFVFKEHLNQHFEFCGEISDPSEIMRFYQEAAVVLIPSYYESGPRTLLEAMLCGKAIITTATGLAKDLIRHGENGILIKPKSADDLAKATLSLLYSENLCKSLGEAARKKVVAEMDSEGNTNRIEEVYAYAIKKCKGKERKLR